MSFMSGFTNFINIDPAKVITNVIGSQANKLMKGNAGGPLAALANPKHGLNMLQYPQDLGDTSGPFVNWIKFNILESVATAGPGSSTVGQFGSGVSNALTGGIAKGSFGILNQGAALINSKVSEYVGSNNLLGQIGLNAANLLSPLRRVRQTSTVISLYIPNQIVFNQQNQYSDLSLTQQLGIALQGAQAAASIQGGDKQGIALPGAELGASASSLAGIDKNLFMTLATGTVVNPQLEVIFQQTDLRTFQFEFVLAARSSGEMDAIESIIKTFRMAAAPKIAGNDGRYLIPPDEFDIEFMFLGGKAGIIPKISTCVLTNLTSDMAPSGQYSVFDDGRPTSVRLTLQFKEVDLITKERIAQGF